MDKSRYSRMDRMVQEKRHDTYKQLGKWPESTVCKECGSLFQNGRWSWNKSIKGDSKVVCPACQRIADNCPAGYIEIKGDFFKGRREELLNLIRSEEQLEREEHPMERIISIIDENDHSLVTTTGVHIAQRIGKALSRACHGDLSIRYGDDEKIIRVYWGR